MTTDLEIKQTLLETTKEMLACGLVEGTAGNISARLTNGNIVMTPTSLDYNKMTLNDLVVTNIDGDVLAGERLPTTEKSLHLACMRKYENIGAVLHCHSMFASMFAINQQIIPCVIEEFSVFVGGDVMVSNYEMSGTDELAEEASRWLKDKGAVLMANHGLLCVGKDAEDALSVALLVERTAKIVWGARLMGEPVPLPESTLKHFSHMYDLMGRNK